MPSGSEIFKGTCTTTDTCGMLIKLLWLVLYYMQIITVTVSPFFSPTQDPAGIFELIEVIGNGTYGQVHKVHKSIHTHVHVYTVCHTWQPQHVHTHVLYMYKCATLFIYNEQCTVNPMNSSFTCHLLLYLVYIS